MPTAIWPGNFLQASFTRSGVAHRDRAENDAGEPLVEPAFDVLQRADAAAELHRAPCGLQDRLDSFAIDRMAGKGAVEVDHVQPFKSRWSSKDFAWAAGSVL